MIDADKRCFTYCGDDHCNCMAHPDNRRIVPTSKVEDIAHAIYVLENTRILEELSHNLEKKRNEG